MFFSTHKIAKVVAFVLLLKSSITLKFAFRIKGSIVFKGILTLGPNKIAMAFLTIQILACESVVGPSFMTFPMDNVVYYTTSEFKLRGPVEPVSIVSFVIA